MHWHKVKLEFSRAARYSDRTKLIYNTLILISMSIVTSEKF